MTERTVEPIMCRYGYVKSVFDKCDGPFCEPDMTDAMRISGCNSGGELRQTIRRIREDLYTNPTECGIQNALALHRLALAIKGEEGDQY